MLLPFIWRGGEGGKGSRLYPMVQKLWDFLFFPKLMGVLSKNVTVKHAGAITSLRLSTQLGSYTWDTCRISSLGCLEKKLSSLQLILIEGQWVPVVLCFFYPWGYCCLFGNLLYLLTSSISTRWSKTLLDNYYYRLNSLKVKSLSHVQTLDSMDYNLPGSSIHGVLQARVLEWVAISFPRGSSWPRERTQVSCIVGRHFTIWDTREIKFSRELKW